MPRPAGDATPDTLQDTTPADTEPAGASWRALGTLVHLLVTEPARLDEARRLLTADLADVDAACSRFRADSEICSLQGGRAEQVSPLLAEAIAVALRAARLTGGDVDPTVGAAMSAVGYDRDFAQVKAGGPGLKLTVRSVPGWHQVRLDGRTLTMPAGVRLDLGATAKAWAADRSAARIAAQLGGGVLVSLGGDIAVAGQVPENSWRVRVQDVTGLPGDPPAGPTRRSPSATAAWPPRAPRRAAGGAAATCCTTSWTHAPACPPNPSGVPYRSPRGAAPTPTRPAPPPSSAAIARSAGWPSWVCPPAWSTRPAWSSPWPAGRMTGRQMTDVRAVRGYAELTSRLREPRSPRMDDVNMTLNGELA